MLDRNVEPDEVVEVRLAVDPDAMNGDRACYEVEHGTAQWTEVEARAVLAAQKKSRHSVDAFTRDNALLPQRLYWWRTKLLGLAARRAF